MSGYVLSVEAEEDLFEIWRYLAEEADLDTAELIESDLYKAFELLVKTPGLGHKRFDLTQHPVLFFSSSTLFLFDRLPNQNSTGNRGCSSRQTGYC